MMGKSSDVIFSTDMYLPNSAKTVERRRRGCGEKLILQGPLTKRPVDWKLFLTNDDNKTQLIKLLLDIWSGDAFAEQLSTQKVSTVSAGHVYCLQTDDQNKVSRKEIASLFSNQEETDSRIILYCKYADEQGYEYVRIRSPDSDVFFVLLHHTSALSCTVMFDTGTGNNRRLINMTELVKDLAPGVMYSYRSPTYLHPL